MDFNELIAMPKIQMLIEDSFASVVYAANTISISSSSIDPSNPEVVNVTIKDLDETVKVPLSPLGAFTLVKGNEALNFLATLYVLVNEETIRGDGMDYGTILDEMIAKLRLDEE